MSLPRTPKAVVFDMDGLLVDTESVYRDVITAVCHDDGHELPLSTFLQMIGHGWETSYQILREQIGADFDGDDFRQRCTRRFYETVEAGVSLKAGVSEILDLLDELDLRRAIATSSSHETVKHHIGGHGMLERFHAIVAQGDYTRSKPAPDPYLLAAERLGVAPSDCLALEDSHTGVRAASSAGMMTIMVPDLLDPTEEMHGLCVRIARDLHEVRALLG